MNEDNSSRSGFRREFLLTVMVIAILVVGALDSTRFFTRFDLTTTRANSISDASRSLFQEIPEDVQITYYVSERLAERFPTPQEIMDLLDEYASSSRGRIRVAVEDPGSEDSDRSPDSLGIVPHQLQVTEEGEQTFAVVYSGIAISYLGRYRTIPFVFSTATLEYELTSTIRDIVANRKKTVRVVIGDESRTLDTDYSYVASQLAQSYDVRDLAAGEPVPDDVDALVVIGGENLDGEGVEALRSYLDRGGSALLAVDSSRVALDRGLVATPVGDAPIRDLLQENGVTLGKEMVLDESYKQIVVQESSAGYSVQRVLPYPLWVSTIEQYTSADHPVTARFTGLNLFWPTYLELADDSPGAIIVGSTARAWLMPAPYRTNPQDAAYFQATAADTRGQYGFVAVVPVESGEATGRLMVVSDSDFMDNRLIQATDSAENLSFVESSVQWLANDEDLLGIRTRSVRDLRLNNIEDPRQKRATVVFAQVLNIYAIPAVVVLIGVLRFLRRRRRASANRGAGA